MIMGVERKWAPTMMKLDASIDEMNGAGNNDNLAANSGNFLHVAGSQRSIKVAQ